MKSKVLADNYSTPSQSPMTADSLNTPNGKSIFTTPKPSYKELHTLTSKCLHECTQWSLGIQLINNDSDEKSKLIKVHNSSIAIRQNGTVKTGPQTFLNDIIDTMISQEMLN